MFVHKDKTVKEELIIKTSDDIYGAKTSIHRAKIILTNQYQKYTHTYTVHAILIFTYIICDRI